MNKKYRLFDTAGERVYKPIFGGFEKIKASLV